jgi:hypothetical protein
MRMWGIAVLASPFALAICISTWGGAPIALSHAVAGAAGAP